MRQIDPEMKRRSARRRWIPADGLGQVQYSADPDGGAQAPSDRGCPVNDLIRELGPIALPSRLRRLSDRLHRDTSRLYRELGLDMEARWFPILVLLAEGKPASVTEIAGRVGMTHPAVHQIVNAMALAGLVHSQTDVADQRRRLLSLSDKGHEVVAQLQPLWHGIRGEMSALLAESGGELMASLAALERRLDECEFYERMQQTSATDDSQPRARRQQG